MKRFVFSIVLLVLSASLSAQNPFQAEYDKFVNDSRKEFDDFRNQCNKEFADFLAKGWESLNSLKGIPKPEEKPVPPVIFDDKKEDKVKNEPVPFEQIEPVPSPEPQPQPITPIQETPQPDKDQGLFHFSFYKTGLKVRAGQELRFTLDEFSPKAYAKLWLKLSGRKYNNLLVDCLKIRTDYRMGDWAYLNMLDTFSRSFLGDNNEAVILTAYLYSQSGYKMRLATSADNKIYLLYCADCVIYDVDYFELNGERFYPFKCEENRLSIVNYSFKDEQKMSLRMSSTMELQENLSETRTLKSEKYGVCAKSAVNTNLIDFFNDYPSSSFDGNFITKWSIYANTPISNRVSANLYPQLKSVIEGKNEHEAVSMLLDFVQTAFVYGMDDELWGGDRAFFAEETLYYPFCDCEDRSILFSHLVRDLIGLDVLLVYYPGHLATAVKFSKDVPGDYFSLNEGKFVVCDPTYIGAPVGATMTDMDNATAKVLLLTKPTIIGE